MRKNRRLSLLRLSLKLNITQAYLGEIERAKKISCVGVVF